MHLTEVNKRISSVVDLLEVSEDVSFKGTAKMATELPMAGIDSYSSFEEFLAKSFNGSINYEVTLDNSLSRLYGHGSVRLIKISGNWYLSGSICNPYVSDDKFDKFYYADKRFPIYYRGETYNNMYVGDVMKGTGGGGTDKILEPIDLDYDSNLKTSLKKFLDTVRSLVGKNVSKYGKNYSVKVYWY